MDPQTFSMNTTKTLKKNLKGFNMLQHVNDTLNTSLSLPQPQINGKNYKYNKGNKGLFTIEKEKT